MVVIVIKLLWFALGKAGGRWMDGWMEGSRAIVALAIDLARNFRMLFG